MNQVQFANTLTVETQPNEFPVAFSYKDLMEARQKKLEDKSQSAGNLRPLKQSEILNSSTKLPSLKSKQPAPTLLKKLNYDFGSLGEFLSYDLKLKRPEEMFRTTGQEKRFEMKNKEEDLKKNLMQHVREQADPRDPKTILLEEKDPEKISKAVRRFISDLMGDIFKDELYVIEKKITQKGIHRLYELVMDLDEDNPVRKIAEKYGYKTLVEKFNILEIEMEKKKNPEIVPFASHKKSKMVRASQLNVLKATNSLGVSEFGTYSSANADSHKQLPKGTNPTEFNKQHAQNSNRALKYISNNKTQEASGYINDMSSFKAININDSPKRKQKRASNDEIFAFASKLFADSTTLEPLYKAYLNEEKELYGKEVKVGEENGKGMDKETLEFEDDDQILSLADDHIFMANYPQKPQFFVHVCLNFPSFQTLQVLNLRGSQVNEAIIWVMLKVIEKYSPNIQFIDLSHNRVSVRVCDALKEIVLKSPLQKLKMANTNLSSKGLAMVCLGLAQNVTLTDIDFNYNDIDEYGYKTLALILRHTQTLNSVKLLRKPKIIITPEGEEKVVRDEFGYNVMAMFQKVFRYNKHLDPKNIELFDGRIN